MLRRRFDAAVSVWTDQGDRRTVNQDRVLVRQGIFHGHSVRMFLLADGCGGMAHGERISQMLVDGFSEIWEEELPGQLTRPTAEFPEAVDSWLQRINTRAWQFGRQTGVQVGSTLSLLFFLDGNYFLFNVGDSRIYLRQKWRVSQLSEDQSILADMLRNREITPLEAESYPGKNALTMCVGYFERVRAFQRRGKLRREDVFLLCSDGLYRGIGESHLIGCIPMHVREDSALFLRGKIPQGGAEDNVTALLVEVLPWGMGVKVEEDQEW